MAREQTYMDKQLVRNSLESLSKLNTEIAERINFEYMLLDKIDELEYDLDRLDKCCTKLHNELAKCKEEEADLLEEATAFKEYVEKTFLKDGEQIIKDDEMQFSIYPEREE